MNPEIISLAKQFRISVISSGKFTAADGLSNEEYLLEVLRAERVAREERATKEHLKQARLPAFKGFEEFDTDFQTGVTRKQLDLLRVLIFLPVKQYKTATLLKIYVLTTMTISTGSIR